MTYGPHQKYLSNLQQSYTKWKCHIQHGARETTYRLITLRLGPVKSPSSLLGNSNHTSNNFSAPSKYPTESQQNDARRTRSKDCGRLQLDTVEMEQIIQVNAKQSRRIRPSQLYLYPVSLLQLVRTTLLEGLQCTVLSAHCPHLPAQRACSCGMVVTYYSCGRSMVAVRHNITS